MATSEAAAPHLSVGRRLLFGLASPPLQLAQNAIGLYLNVFLLEAAKLRPLLISAVLFSGRFVDAVSDPLIGYGVSRTRTRLGKCRPWLLASAPLSALTFLLLWLPPRDDWSDPGRLAFYLPAYVAFSLAISCYYIPYTTMTMRISASSKDRDSATAYRMAFEMLGILLGPIFFAFIVEPKRTSVACSDASMVNGSVAHGAAGGNATLIGNSEEKVAYMTSAACVSTLILLCGVTGFIGLREVDTPGESHAVSSAPDGLTKYLKQCRRVVTYGPFLRATVIFITLSLSWHIFQAISILYVTHVMQLGGHVRLCTLVYLVAALAATPVWHAFSVRFSKKLALQFGSVGTAGCCLLAGLMPPGIVPLFYGMVVFAGILGANALLLSWSTLPDVIQSFYRDRGIRLEAVFYSTFTFANKCAVSLSMAGLNLALDLAGYNRFSCRQPAGLVTALRCLLISPLPLLCLAVYFSWRLPTKSAEGDSIPLPTTALTVNAADGEVDVDSANHKRDVECKDQLQVRV